MLPKLFLLFLLLPLIELFLLIKLGSVLGALPTVALCIATAAAGSYLIRWQGLSTVMRLRESLDKGDLPALEIAEGAALLVAGALLLTPGLATDLLGFAILVPPLRREVLLRLLARHMRPAGDGYTVDGEATAPGSAPRRIVIMNGEFKRLP